MLVCFKQCGNLTDIDEGALVAGQWQLCDDCISDLYGDDEEAQGYPGEDLD